MIFSIKHLVTEEFLEGLLLNQACKKSFSSRNRKNLFRSGVDFSELKLN